MSKVVTAPPQPVNIKTMSVKLHPPRVNKVILSPAAETHKYINGVRQ